MFIAHCQIYHIDQHTSRILCEHEKDGIPCHYMTDRESDLKAHIHKLHETAIKEKQATNSYVAENAWLDLTSSWSIKDLERSFKTFLDSHCGLTYKLIVWVIMNTDSEDPRTTANIFRVSVFGSQEWATMISLGTHTIKETNTALAEKRESLPKVTTKEKKSRA